MSEGPSVATPASSGGEETSSTSSSSETTSGGIGARLRSAVPITVNESGWAYDGPFSTYKEFHAAILGFAAGFIGSPELQGAVVAFAMGRGSKGSRADAHWRQVVEEPAYALGAMTVGTAARRQEFLMAALDVVTGLL